MMPTSDLLAKRDAVISYCGAYRYTLKRKWAAEFYPMLFVMLNPSTADAVDDDPTIRRCIGFAKREHCTAILVLNLFAFRSPSPREMMAASDPVGPNNDDYLCSAFFNAALRGAPIVAAWGAHGNFQRRAAAVLSLATSQQAKLMCLGRTSSGAPRHPLYLPKDAPLAEWKP